MSPCACDGSINIDKYLMWVIGEVQKQGKHSSIYLSLLGYASETGQKRDIGEI